MRNAAKLLGNAGMINQDFISRKMRSAARKMGKAATNNGKGLNEKWEMQPKN